MINLATVMHGRYGLRRWGLVGGIGLLLVLCAAWVQWQWLPQRQADLAMQASELRALRHVLQAAEPVAQTAPLQRGQRASQPPGEPAATSTTITSAEQAWATWWGHLPAAAQRTRLQAAVTQGAQGLGLQVAAVRYQGEPLPWAPGVWRQRMSLPVQGHYAAVQAWLTQLLREPALSIEALQIQRDHPQQDTVQAQVQLSLWWRQPGGDQP